MSASSAKLMWWVSKQVSITVIFLVRRVVERDLPLAFRQRIVAWQTGCSIPRLQKSGFFSGGRNRETSQTRPRSSIVRWFGLAGSFQMTRRPSTATAPSWIAASPTAFAGSRTGR